MKIEDVLQNTVPEYIYPLLRTKYIYCYFFTIFLVHFTPFLKSHKLIFIDVIYPYGTLI